MGSVFLCEHADMRRRVAIKILPPDKAGPHPRPAVPARGPRRPPPSTTRTSSGPTTWTGTTACTSWSWSTSTGRACEIVRDSRAAVTSRRACHYVAQAALGLQHAHENGLVHRDVKPANLLVDRAGVVKVLDLGLARFFRDERTT